jgi:hypothetical protein
MAAVLTAFPTQEEWLWGWDPTPGIVSVWAEASGHASVWRRTGPGLELVYERARYRPWLLLASLADLKHLGASLQPEAAADPSADPNLSDPAALLRYRELEGSGELRFLVSAESSRRGAFLERCAACASCPRRRSCRSHPRSST